MSKYIDEDCKQCDEYFSRYGCTNHNCPIYIDYMEGQAEMAADEDLEKRKDLREGL